MDYCRDCKDPVGFTWHCPACGDVVCFECRDEHQGQHERDTWDAIHSEPELTPEDR